jgi:TRAP-type C4-dicarboxylate transport system permease small subunit
LSNDPKTELNPLVNTGRREKEPVLKRLDRPLHAIADVMAIAGGWALTILAVTVSVETFLRKFAKVSIQGLDEYGGYVLAISSAFGFTATLLTRAHVRVDVVVRFLPPPLRAWADIFALVTLGFFSTMVLMYGWRILSSSWALEARAVSPIQTPLVIPQGLWVLALTLFAFACGVLTLRVLGAAARRDYAEVSRHAGVPTAEEHTKEKGDDVKRRETTVET